MLRNRESDGQKPGVVKRLWRIIVETVTRWSGNDGLMLAAATAYYAAFSFFPLLMVLLAGIGFALRFSSNAQNAQNTLLDLIKQHTGSELASQVSDILSQVRTRASFSGVIGLATLFFGAIGVFSQFDSAFNRFWHQRADESSGIWAMVRNALWNRLKAFLTLLGLGLVMIAGFAADLALSALRSSTQDLALDTAFWQWVQMGSGVVLNAVAMMLVYRLIPRPGVRWLHAAIGGVVVAIVWQIGGQVVSRLLIGGNYSAYGVVGSFIAMMLWVYYASIVLFLGAQLVQVLGNPENGGRAAADGNRPAEAPRSQ